MQLRGVGAGGGIRTAWCAAVGVGLTGVVRVLTALLLLGVPLLVGSVAAWAAGPGASGRAGTTAGDGALDAPAAAALRGQLAALVSQHPELAGQADAVVRQLVGSGGVTGTSGTATAPGPSPDRQQPEGAGGIVPPIWLLRPSDLEASRRVVPADQREGGDASGPDGASSRASLLGPSTQPALYAIFNRIGGHATGYVRRGEIPGLLLTDALTQSMFHWRPFDDPMASAALHVLITAGLFFGGNEINQGWNRLAREALRRHGHGVPAEAMPDRIWPGHPFIHTMINGALLMGEGPTKEAFRDIGWLPQPVVTVGGRPRWTSGADYWWDLGYDAFVHALVVGGLTGSSYRLPEGFVDEFVGTDPTASQRLPLWMRSPWLGGLASGAIAAASKLLSELITNPPPGLVEHGWWQQLDRLWRGADADADSFWALAGTWQLNSWGVPFLLAGDLAWRNLNPLLSWPLWIQRAWLSTLQKVAEATGDTAWAEQLAQDPAHALLTPGTRQAAQAARGRSDQAARALVAFPDPKGPAQRLVRRALNELDLAANLADAAIAWLWPGTADTDRAERVTAALDRARHNLARIDQDRAALHAWLVATPDAVGAAVWDAMTPATAAATPAPAGPTPAPAGATPAPALPHDPAPDDGSRAAPTPPGPPRPSGHQREPGAADGAWAHAVVPQAGSTGDGLVRSTSASTHAHDRDQPDRPPAADPPTPGADVEPASEPAAEPAGTGPEADGDGADAATERLGVMALETAVGGVPVRWYGPGKVMQVVRQPDGTQVEVPYDGPDPFGGGGVATTPAAGADEPPDGGQAPQAADGHQDQAVPPGESPAEQAATTPAGPTGESPAEPGVGSHG
jgi:hypothetical protein